MINPVHRLKKPIKYSGNGKPDDYHVTEERGWLGSGVIDKNGVEIFEGDFVKVIFDICDEIDSPAIITFDKGTFWINPEGKYYTRYPIFDSLHASFEVVGHVTAEENKA